MSQKQIDKERIRLTREIATLENQLTAAMKGKEDKLEENKLIREEIARLEEENKGLEEETRRLDEEIAKLDEEFKSAQIDAGRLRREIKINTERSENERKKAEELRGVIFKLESQFESLRREIKTEIDDRRTLEARLRKTNAHINAMKENRAARIFVTKRLEKQDWYTRQEEPDLEFLSDEEIPHAASQTEQPVSSESESVKTETKEDKKDDGGIDFSVD